MQSTACAPDGDNLCCHSWLWCWVYWIIFSHLPRYILYLLFIAACHTKALISFPSRFINVKYRALSYCSIRIRYFGISFRMKGILWCELSSLHQLFVGKCHCIHHPSLCFNKTSFQSPGASGICTSTVKPFKNSLFAKI